MLDRKVSQYVASNCATYAGNGLCHLETDSTGGRLCPLMYDLGKTCSYAERSVIPGDATILALYNAGKAGASANLCERCKSPFDRTSNRQKYCPKCTAIVRSEQEAKRKREARLKAALSAGTNGRI